jgi:hypothetical protein
MIGPIKQNVLFGTFVVIAVGAAVVEAYLLIRLVDDPSWPKVGGVVASTVVLGGCGLLYRELIEKTFLRSAITPLPSLTDLTAERVRIAGLPLDEFDMTVEQVTNTLIFAEKCLRPWRPGTHFELSVFIDQSEPLLLAYYDSNASRRARSMSDRERSRTYYVDKRYEVVGLLAAPSSFPKVIPDTQAAGVEYTFASANQSKQILSTILTCLDTASPCALVLASNSRNAFAPGDSEFMWFLRYVGLLIWQDLHRDHFVNRVRAMRPALFTPTSEVVKDPPELDD